jgi:hypothetical protein
MFQVLQAFQTYVSSVLSECYKLIWDVAYVASLCFKCFRRRFEVFHLDVAYAAMALYACFKRMFQVFLMFQNHVTSVQVYHLDVTKVDLDGPYVAIAIHACFKHMFRMLHLF